MTHLTTAQFLALARQQDIQLWAEGDRLKFSAPENRLTPELRDELKRRKAELLDALRLPNEAPPIAVRPSGAPMELSFAQQRLWFMDQLLPGNAFYNIPLNLSFSGPLNKPALEQCLNELTRRHQVLRLRIPAEQGKPAPQLRPFTPAPLPSHDLSHLPEAERQGRLETLISEEGLRPFDMEKGPLVRFQLVRLGDLEHVLLTTWHHIVCDGWSLTLIARELAQDYASRTSGQSSPPAPAEPAFQYADFAHWQRQWLQGKSLDKQLKYWREQLANLPPALDLPMDQPRPAVQTFRGGRVASELSSDLTQRINAFSRKCETTPFTVVLSAFNVLLSRLSQQTDIAVGTPIAGRTRVELESLVGLCANTLVLRTQFDPDIPFLQLLGRVREIVLGAFAHQELPIEKLVEELHPERTLSHSPLFQVMFNWINLRDHRLDFPQLRAQQLPNAEAESKFDLTLYARETNGALHFVLVYNAGLFSASRMQEMLRQLEHLLLQLLAKPDQPISSHSLVTPQSKTLLPDPARIYPEESDPPIPWQVSRQAQIQPSAEAIVDPETNWTFQELDQTSNRIARELLARGVQKGDAVAVFAQRDASLVLALLGILKAGGAFFILDPAYPAARLRDCLERASAKAWIQPDAAGPIPPPLEPALPPVSLRLHLPAGAALKKAFLHQSPLSPESPITPNDRAYIAFTSGSTGSPKAIAGAHAPLSHFLKWQRETFELSSRDRFSMLSGLSHDPLLRDIFAPLCAGGTLCIPSPEDIAPRRLPEWLRRNRITCVHLTPPISRFLADDRFSERQSAPAFIDSLRWMFFGGDILTHADLERVRSVAPSAQCVNFYGATETPQAMGFFVLPRSADPDRPASGASRPSETLPAIPLGRGIRDVDLLILNERGELRGIGEPGEIHVRTRFLSQGYLGDETSTQARFLQNPFTKETSDRMYKTGDWGRYAPDGSVHFSGRRDFQVKLRGFRIELGEIESILVRHPSISQAVVLLREDSTGEKSLAAYVVPRSGNPSDLNLPALREFARGCLPDYMTPAAFVPLPAIPLTPNGKVDRRALPSPDPAELRLTSHFTPPRTPVEEELAGIWSQFLPSKRIGAFDNFFELGGHSLLAAQVISRIRDNFQIDLPLRSLFEAPTIEQLALAVTQAMLATEDDEEILGLLNDLPPASADSSDPRRGIQQEPGAVHRP